MILLSYSCFLFCYPTRRLEPGDLQPNSKLKYLTGEWFYEAKSRRHMDTIHGSEIILASMKQRKAGSLGRFRRECCVGTNKQLYTQFYFLLQTYLLQMND